VAAWKMPANIVFTFCQHNIFHTHKWLPHSDFIRVENEHMEDILKPNPHENQILIFKSLNLSSECQKLVEYII
jgi:hypothetical protein